MRDVGILGGGISGLFLAHFLGGDVEVLEADATVGGLARCFGGSGFRSDIGGHILFSKDKEALSHEIAVLGDNVRLGVRANKILYGGLHVKYPFENGIDVLPKEEIVDILETFIDNPHKAPPTNFRDWMYSVFGSGLTDRYLLPYNEKIWKTPAAQMSLEWVERVPRPPLRDLLKTAVGIPTEGYTHQLHFRYPKLGGFEALPQTLAARLGPKVHTGFRAEKLSRCEGGWCVRSSSGEERRYRKLVSTMPVGPMLESMLDEPVPSAVLDAVRGLVFNSIRVVLIGVETTELPDYTALYVPDPSSVYHRVCYNHVFSPDMVPPGCRSVSAEITMPPGSELDGWSREKFVERTIADLARDAIIDPRTVCFSDVHYERFAYVVYTLGYAERVRLIRSYVESLGIELTGRFAEYEYINSDACVRHALDLARKLRGGSIAEDARIEESEWVS